MREILRSTLFVLAAVLAIAALPLAPVAADEMPVEAAEEAVQEAEEMAEKAEMAGKKAEEMAEKAEMAGEKAEQAGEMAEQMAAGEMPEGWAEMMAAWEKAMTPGPQHEAMAGDVGKWNLEIKSWMDPEAEPMVSAGTAERTLILEGRVLEEHVDSDMMGTPFHGIGQRGYDNVTGKHWSTWMDTMSTGVYVQWGEERDDGSVEYHGEYADPMSGDMIKVRSVAYPDKDGKEVFHWYEDRGAGEVRTMEIVYTPAGD